MLGTIRFLETFFTSRWSVPLALAALLLPACGSTDDGATPPIETATPTETAPQPQVSGTSEPRIAEEPLVYVPMGNSLTFSPGRDHLIALYTAMLEEDFDVDVERRDHTVGDQSTENFLARLQTDERLREDLAAADVITLLIPNYEWAEPFQTAAGIRGNDPSDCGGDDNQQCLRDVIESYKQHVDQIFDELTAVVDPADTVVRVQDFYQFGTSEMTQEGFAATNPYWREAQEYVEQVAGQYGIPVAQVFDDFMGTDGSYVDLVAEGLVEPDDIHPTAQGAERMATLMHELGYDLANEPGDREAAFDFEQHTLCDWFTADRMDSIVAEAMERAGVDVEVESFSTGGECRMVAPVTQGAIWDTPGWSSQSDGGLGIHLAPVTNDRRGEEYLRTDPADFERHSVLHDAVTYGNFGSGFAYSPGVRVQLLVEGHGDEVLFLGFGVEGAGLHRTSTAQQTAFALSVADIMLTEMNWTE